MHLNPKIMLFNAILILLAVLILASCTQVKPPETVPTEPPVTSEPDSAEESTHLPIDDIVMITEQTKCQNRSDEEYRTHLCSLLAEKGYHGWEAKDGVTSPVVRTDFNYNNLEKVFDCTSPYVTEHSDIRLWRGDDWYYFLEIDGELYRYDTTGGYHHNLCLWDYDGNGVKDIVALHTWGSGLSYEALDIFDVVEKRDVCVKTVMTLSDSPFRFDFDGEHIYVDEQLVVYVLDERSDRRFEFQDVSIANAATTKLLIPLRMVGPCIRVPQIKLFVPKMNRNKTESSATMACTPTPNTND